MTFEKWLIMQKGRNDPVGDLANDFIVAKTVGEKLDEEHLAKWNAFEAAYDALKQARKEYKKFKGEL